MQHHPACVLQRIIHQELDDARMPCRPSRDQSILIVAIDDGFTADDVTVTGSAGEFVVTVPGTLTGDFTSLSGATDPSVSVA